MTTIPQAVPAATDPAPARGAPLALSVVSAGLCCAVGQSLDAASAALLANVDHFHESEFQTHSGDAIRVARLPGENAWGAARVARWLAMALEDARRGLPADTQSWTPDACALLLLCDEPVHTTASWGREVFDGCRLLTGWSFHHSSAILPTGRAGFAALCTQAQRLLADHKDLRHVIVAGASSLLNARRINQLLKQQRLQVPGNADGFFPGEAAAALVLARGDEGPVVLRAAGVAQEAGLWSGEVPNRAEGLTGAVRAACDAARITPRDLGLRLSDVNGEAFYARESATAFTRLMQGGAQLAHVTPAGGLGEIGAALGPAAVAYLWHRAQRPLRPAGWPGLPASHAVLHLSDDRGVRAAMLIGLRPAWALPS